MSGYVTFVPVQLISPGGYAAQQPYYLPSAAMPMDPSSLMYTTGSDSAVAASHHVHHPTTLTPYGKQHQQHHSHHHQSLPQSARETRQHNPYASVAIVHNDEEAAAAGHNNNNHQAWGSEGAQRTIAQHHQTPTTTSPTTRLPHQTHVVTLDEVLTHQGTYAELARTANGSSFIQSALRDGSDDENLQVIWRELQPIFSDLLLDAHGCYVIKSILERLPAKDLSEVVASVARDEQLVFSMCTHSLHTRRVVQFLLDSVDCAFIINLLTAHCTEIATTQQGCIVMQRAMDVAREPQRAALFSVIYAHLTSFATDPFGNYVVQHLLEVGDRNINSLAFTTAIAGHVVMLSCNKFASNVMEKALFHLNADAQHTILMEMYGGGEEVLYRMLQDSFGNYIIQSSIALACFKDVFLMSEKLRPVLQRTPYGHKIEARLDRRLKGKPVGTRSPMIGSYGRGGAPPQQQQQAQQPQQQPQQQQGHHGSYAPHRGGGRHYNNNGYRGAQHNNNGEEEPW